ncbi:hypothetical protein VitviT2T_010080 [Vitis vinifera]|uniref:Uncharacterized protein n=1 Tax=Vitis vinifera TaxID=29760 RepID=A0ABY9C7I7_VITVI|nr:hypothetical protein VitviT2T_010080 [Vitis vinifera]
MPDRTCDRKTKWRVYMSLDKMVLVLTFLDPTNRPPPSCHPRFIPVFPIPAGISHSPSSRSCHQPKPSFLVRIDSRKRGDFSLTTPLGGGRPGRVKKKSLKVAAKKAAGGADDARLERWTVRKFGALGDGFGLELEPNPSL